MAASHKAKKAQKELTVSRPELLIEGSDRSFRQLVHDMLAFSARIQEVRSRLGSVMGLSGIQYTVLIAIAHLQTQRDEVGVTAVAEHLHLSGPFVTIEVNKLVTAGLVEKQTNADDRRRVLLTTTKRAEDALRGLTSVQRPANDALFSSLSGQDFKKLGTIASDLVKTGDDALRLLDYLVPAAVAANSRSS